MQMKCVPVSIEPDQRRRGLIRSHASSPDRRYDICVVAVGSRKAYREAIQKLKPRGRLVVFSGSSPADDLLEISFNQLHYLEQTIKEELKNVVSGFD